MGLIIKARFLTQSRYCTLVFVLADCIAEPDYRSKFFRGGANYLPEPFFERAMTGIEQGGKVFYSDISFILMN